MNEPLVSICIPTYNGEAFLEQCLQSCLNQTFDNYEVVVCDDGSTDSTPAILDTFAKQNSRVRLINNPVNLGLVGNWNNCIEQARGTWIKFVFQDDYISADCLAVFVAAIDEQVKLMVCERHFVLPANADVATQRYYTHEVRTLKNTSLNNTNHFSAKEVSCIAAKHIAMNFIAEPSLSFFKKDLLRQVGPFNKALKQLCDLEFMLRVSSNYGLVYIPQKLCAFRIHSNSTTSSNARVHYFEMRYIEPLLLLYFLLYGQQFASLRKNLNWIFSFKLKLAFRVKAYNAWRLNNIENRNHVVFKEESPYKEIVTLCQGNFFIRLLARKYR